MKTLIIIPCFNEAENIERVVTNLTVNYPQYDYVVINDGSADDTAGICRQNRYNLIDLPINLGLAGGFQTGMRYACRHGYDCAAQLDGDGQHDPRYLSLMIEKMEREGLDFVIGSRFVSAKKPRSMRMFGSNLISLILKITTGKTIKDPTSGMRVFNRKLIEIMADSPDYGPEPDTLAHLIRSGAKFSEVQAEMNERIAGESYLNASWSVKYMVYIISSMVFMQWFRKKPVLRV